MVAGDFRGCAGQRCHGCDNRISASCGDTYPVAPDLSVGTPVNTRASPERVMRTNAPRRTACRGNQTRD